MPLKEITWCLCTPLLYTENRPGGSVEMPQPQHARPEAVHHKKAAGERA